MHYDTRLVISSTHYSHLDTAFDVIGDVHGCLDELDALLIALGYEADDVAGFRHPAGRLAVFVGDLVDRGPRNVDTLTLVMRMVAAGTALAVPGNHDVQFQKYLEDPDSAPVAYGLDVTMREVEPQSIEFKRAVIGFFRNLPGHLVLDDGRLVVAHAGLAERFHGSDDRLVRHLAVYGVPRGLPGGGDMATRHRWLADYAGGAAVVHGHTPVQSAVWRNNSIDIDTGCVYGGALTALRWPERTLVSVDARDEYHALD